MCPMVVRSLLAMLVSCAAFAQTPAFEVASVKPADTAVYGRQGIDFRVLPGGRLHATSVTLQQLILQAYALKHYQLAGGPGWLPSERFDIDAESEGQPSQAQMMAMLQTLLTERFQLKTHREPRNQSIYGIVVAKGGAKLHAAKQDDLPAAVRHALTGSPAEKKTYVLTGHKATLAIIAENLGEAQRPVLDRTAIPGEFDFRLEFVADDSKPEDGRSLFTAIQEQLGLKLEPGKGPVEVLVVDHAEKPSAN